MLKGNVRGFILGLMLMGKVQNCGKGHSVSRPTQGFRGSFVNGVGRRFERQYLGLATFLATSFLSAKQAGVKGWTLFHNNVQPFVLCHHTHSGSCAACRGHEADSPRKSWRWLYVVPAPLWIPDRTAVEPSSLMVGAQRRGPQRNLSSKQKSSLLFTTIMWRQSPTTTKVRWPA